MSLNTYLVLHVSSIFVLLGYTFYAFAAPAETRKRVLMITGVASLLILVTGFGMLHRLQLGFPGWAIVKLVCWLGLSAMAGLAFRRRAQADLFMIIAFVLAITAAAMVIVRPFYRPAPRHGRHALWRLDRRGRQGPGLRRLCRWGQGGAGASFRALCVAREQPL
jgi:hypothetical protein